MAAEVRDLSTPVVVCFLGQKIRELGLARPHPAQLVLFNRVLYVNLTANAICKRVVPIPESHSHVQYKYQPLLLTGHNICEFGDVENSFVDCKGLIIYHLIYVEEDAFEGHVVHCLIAYNLAYCF